MEEGVDFVNTLTNQIEKDALVVYQNFQAKTGTFALPNAKVSHKGFEKNILEVLGHYLAFNENDQISDILASADFRYLMRKKIETIRRKENAQRQG